MLIQYIVPVCLVLSIAPAYSAVHKQSTIFLTEETIEGLTFKHVLELENATKKETYTINNKSVTPEEYEKQLLEAEKEASKRDRRTLQEERLKTYETQYKGQVKQSQLELKKVLGSVTEQLNQIFNERLAPFLLYGRDTLTDEQITALNETLIPQATKLLENSPETIDIKKIQELKAELSRLLPRLHAFFIASVNNGIDKADDTKLLKELLSLL